MKNYLALIAGLTLSGASVVTFASSHAVESGNYGTDQQQAKGSMSFMDPDKLEGVDIYNGDQEQIGDVDEVVVNKSGERMIVIGLEDSTKEVVVPLDKLAWSSDGKSLTTRMSKEELEAMPDYDPMDMQSADE